MRECSNVPLGADVFSTKMQYSLFLCCSSSHEIHIRSRNINYSVRDTLFEQMVNLPSRALVNSNEDNFEQKEIL